MLRRSVRSRRLLAEPRVLQERRVEILHVPAVRRPLGGGESHVRLELALREVDLHREPAADRRDRIPDAGLIVLQQTKHDEFALLEFLARKIVARRALLVPPHSTQGLKILCPGGGEVLLHGRAGGVGTSERAAGWRSMTCGCENEDYGETSHSRLRVVDESQANDARESQQASTRLFPHPHATSPAMFTHCRR